MSTGRGGRGEEERGLSQSIGYNGPSAKSHVLMVACSSGREAEINTGGHHHPHHHRLLHHMALYNVKLRVIRELVEPNWRWSAASLAVCKLTRVFCVRLEWTWHCCCGLPLSWNIELATLSTVTWHYFYSSPERLSSATWRTLGPALWWSPPFPPPHWKLKSLIDYFCKIYFWKYIKNGKKAFLTLGKVRNSTFV